MLSSPKINALMMDSNDNVVTCVTAVTKGDTVIYRKNDEYCSIQAMEDIPYCHKIALVPLSEHEHILKYGESIGVATRNIAAGCLVNHLNICSVPRDYESEMVPLD